jgi:hypothetical protein
VIIIALSLCFPPEKWGIGKEAATAPETGIIMLVVSNLEGSPSVLPKLII